MTYIRTRPIDLYVASILGAGYAFLVALIGATEQSLLLLVHGIIGLLLYASVALFAQAIAETANPRRWILGIILLAVILAFASVSVTSLIGYSPAVIALVVSCIRGLRSSRMDDPTPS